MRLSTEIVRTPFGVSDSYLSAVFRGNEGWDDVKRRHEIQHQKSVEALIGAIPRRAQILGETSGYRQVEDRLTERISSGRTGEFWTVVVHDDQPLHRGEGLADG